MPLSKYVHSDLDGISSKDESFPADISNNFTIVEDICSGLFAKDATAAGVNILRAFSLSPALFNSVALVSTVFRYENSRIRIILIRNY